MPWGSWISRHKWSTLSAATATVVAAATSIYLWSYPTRQLLGGYDFDSITYLKRQAQPWLTAPAASSSTCRWKMNEAAGDITDDLCSGAVLTANGTPKYQLYTPIPTSTGFDRKSIGFLGTEWFAAANSTVLDQATNDFSVTIWFHIWTTHAANAYLVSKRTGNTGWSVYLDTSNRLNFEIGDGTLLSGIVSATLPYGWHLATVRWTRNGTASAEVDSNTTNVEVDISARSGSVTSATPFTIGRLSSGGNAFTGGIAEVMVANATRTQDEHQASFRGLRLVQPYVNSREWPKPAKAAAGQAWGWPMQETSGSIIDTLSGSSIALAAINTPVYNQWTPRQKGPDGTYWRAVKISDVSQDGFVAADPAVADATAGDWSAAAWVYTTKTAQQVILDKADADSGYEVYLTAANALYLWLDGDTAVASSVNCASTLSTYTWYHVAVAVDRGAAKATCWVNGMPTATVAFATTGSMTSTVALRVGRTATPGSYQFKGLLGGVMFANGALTDAEVKDHYISNATSPVFAGNSTTRLYPLPSDATGNRLGVYSAGSSGIAGSNPIMYHSSLVDVTSNPLGLGLPLPGSVTNVIGYPRAFDQWNKLTESYSPPTVTANTHESPDGSFTADTVAFGDYYGPISYPQNSGVAPVNNAYTGAAVCPTQRRVYFSPYAQGNQANWHYVDITTNNVVAYAHGMAGVVATAYIGAVYEPVNDRVYFVPNGQGNQANWHYIDCATGNAVAYAAGVGAVATAYDGGAYDPTNGRVYFAPYLQATQANWHYIDLATGAATAYAHGAVVTAAGYVGAIHDPVNNRIYFAPYGQSDEVNWHYVDEATGNVVAYAHGLTLGNLAYNKGVLDPVHNRIYLTPYVQAVQATWHYIDLATGALVGYSPGTIFSSYAGDAGYSVSHDRVYFPPWNQASSTTWSYVTASTNLGSWFAHPDALPAAAYFGSAHDAVTDRIYFAPYAAADDANWHYIGTDASVTSKLTKTVVGGGSTNAYDRWYASLYYKRISGTACDIRLYNGTTAYTTLGTATTWSRADVTQFGSAVTKQIQLSRNSGTDCVYAFSDAQYEQYRLGYPSTYCATDANCTGNSTGLYLQTTPYFAMYSSQQQVTEDIWRGEVEIVHTEHHNNTSLFAVLGLNGAYRDYVAYPIASQSIGKSYLSGGAAESVSYQKPFGVTESKMKTTWSFDMVDGLTNTSPRRYTALSRDDVMDKVLLAPRSVSATTQIPYPVNRKQKGLAAERDVNAYNQVVESIKIWSRPERKVRSETTKPVVAVDTSMASYLGNASVPRFECPNGLATANCRVWDHTEYPGSYSFLAMMSPLYDRINQIPLNPTGAHANLFYQINSGMIGRGRGRGSTAFVKANGQRFYAASTKEVDLSALNAFTFEALYYPIWKDTAAGRWAIIDSSGTGLAGSGITLWSGNTGFWVCSLVLDNAFTTYIYATSNSVLPDRQWSHLACTLSKDPGTGAWTIKQYQNGIDVTGVPATGGSGGFVNHFYPFSIGGSAGSATYTVDGQIAEAAVSNYALSASEVLAHYKQTTQQGTHWTNSVADSFVAHWLFNDYYYQPNGSLTSVLFDDTPNNNHLTMASATAPYYYSDGLKYPAGSGVVKPAVGTKGAGACWTGDTLAPDDSQSFSMIAWARCGPIVGVGDIFLKGGANPIYRMWIDSSGRLNCQITDSGGNASTSQNATNICDGTWHLVACKATWNGANYVMTSNLDAAGFGNAGAAIVGTVSGNANAITSGCTSNAADRLSMSGAAIFKNYALSDGEVTPYYRHGADPTGVMTYTRASTSGVCHVASIDRATGINKTCFRDNQVPFAWSVNPLSSASGTAATSGAILLGTTPSSPILSMPVFEDQTNYAQYSEDITSWTLTNVTTTADSIPAPDGNLSADTVTQTVANAIHSVSTTGVNVAQNDWATAQVDYKQGSATGYIKLYMYDTEGDVAWANYSVSGTTPVGLSGVSGSFALALTPITTQGSVAATYVQGWVQARFAAQCTRVGGCTAVRLGLCFETANNNSSTCPTFVGATTTYLYLWGGSLTKGYLNGIYNPAYCRNLSNGNSTCSAPTAQYVPAATIASWDRSNGVVYQRSCVARGANVSQWRLTNGLDNVGDIRFSMPNASATGTGLYVYDSSGVLQQNVRQYVGSAEDRSMDFYAEWDSTGAFYGTRRSYAASFDSARNQGTWADYATDLAANWTPAAATNLWVGMDSTGGASTLQCYHQSTLVFTR